MYTISKRAKMCVVSESVLSPFFLVHDKPATGTGQDLLKQYLDDARSIFKSECDILLGTDRPFTEGDASRLSIMLKLLMDARKTWQEEENDMARQKAEAKPVV